MALPTTRTDFKAYILRKLGGGAIDINVTDEQVEDRIDEALEHFTEYHDEGTERNYIAHQLDETDITNKYISLSDNVVGVSGIFTGDKTVSSFYDVEYQYMQDNITSIANAEMRYFYIAMKHIEMIESMFDYLTPIRYNTITNRLYIDENWSNYSSGNYLIVDAFTSIDSTTQARIWKNKWLRDYTAALVKMQWGQNLGKYDGIQVIGGVSFNASRLIEEARQELEQLEEQVKVTESVPLGIFIG